ncbi:MAG: ACT domain-containing protein [Candidatus Sumerlaeaceae bacterium]|nr:ACT domain-containing protein [Candidatus Sumerlaeaceae bacterium]
MQNSMLETETPTPTSLGTATVRLVVRNHPGVMSHICGLFARRSFNLEAIACLPLDDGTRSGMLLGVREEDRITQLIAQLRKLEDVLDVRIDPQGREAFEAVREYMA